MNIDSDIQNSNSASNSSPSFPSLLSGDLLGRMKQGGTLPSSSTNTSNLLDTLKKSNIMNLNDKPHGGAGSGGDINTKLAPSPQKQKNLQDAFGDPKKAFFGGTVPKEPAKLKRDDDNGAETKKPQAESSTADAAVSGNADADGADKKTEGKKKKRARWKKPKDKPNRPLSAYNLFFQAQRVEMLGDSAPTSDSAIRAGKRIHRKTHGKIGFAEMARVIGQKWKNLPAEEKQPFEEQAAKEKKRYSTELEVWKQEQKRKAKASKISQKQARLKSSLESAGVAAGGDSSSAAADSHLRVQMMLAGDYSGSQGGGRPDGSVGGSMEYLRALQERQQRAALLGRSTGMMGDSLFSQYPSAAEASASALLQQFQGGGGGPSDSQFATPQEVQVQLLELQKQQLELQQKQLRLQAAMQNTPGMAGAVGASGPVGSASAAASLSGQGFGGGAGGGIGSAAGGVAGGSSSAAHQQALQQQFGGTSSENMAAAMMRFRHHQNFGGM